MSKFLRIVENNLPSEHESQLGKMVDKLAELLNTIGSVEVNSTAPSKELTVNINGHTIVLDVKDVTVTGDEDEETGFGATYNLNKGVEGLAAQAKSGAAGAVANMFGTDAQKARTAVKDRQAVVKKAIPVYAKVTKSLSDALTKATQDITKDNQTVANPTAI
jgi:hypothetical protein